MSASPVLSPSSSPPAPATPSRARCPACRRVLVGEAPWVSPTGSVVLGIPAHARTGGSPCPGAGARVSPLLESAPAREPASAHEASDLLCQVRNQYREAERILWKQVLGIEVPRVDVTDLYGVAPGPRGSPLATHGRTG